MKKITLPTIHSNGTSREMLLNPWKEVSKKIKELEDCLEKVEFNGRDYYLREGSFDEARKEMGEMYQNLKQVKEYCDGMLFGIFDGGHKTKD